MARAFKMERGVSGLGAKCPPFNDLGAGKWDGEGGRGARR
jgi:hypothetical protein